MNQLIPAPGRSERGGKPFPGLATRHEMWRAERRPTPSLHRKQRPQDGAGGAFQARAGHEQRFSRVQPVKRNCLADNAFQEICPAMAPLPSGKTHAGDRGPSRLVAVGKWTDALALLGYPQSDLPPHRSTASRKVRYLPRQEASRYLDVQKQLGNRTS